ncbi:zinc finger HIT domain-containing protein 2 [Trichomycterus rosablanca]|uniref:zinc finger HIT domain-containing protein 2 n=1 Tax=Trichomycterus rosablanca TaxID=2290929 RepID=UPI002F357239
MMQFGFRRNLPACFHSFLTNIWTEEPLSDPHTDVKPEERTKDGISLPVNAVCDLTPAGDDEHRGSSSSSPRPCGLCVVQPARYTCPRCNVPYCSLSCYRGDAHTSCSEDFYRECVSQELKLRGGSDQEVQRNMREILLRLRSDHGTARELTEEERLGTEKLTLLSRLAQIQETGLEGHEDEVEKILHQLGQIGNEGEDTEEDEEDLATRLSGVNIDALTGDELWKLLPEKEKQKFQRLLKGGEIGAVVPVWRPWWEEHEQDASALIEEIQSNEQEETSSEDANEDNQRATQDVKKTSSKRKSSRPPQISAGIPPLSSLCTTPSPAVKFSLVNALYGYTFCLHLFNGDVSEPQQQAEFSRLLLSVSECLGRGRNFHSFSEALCSATAAVTAGRYDSDSALGALRSVAHILTGRSRSDPAGYALSALSHLSSVFSGVRANTSKQDGEFRRACFLAGRKCTFLQAWVTESGEELRRLAREAWRESGRAREERERMEREKEGLKDEWRKKRTERKLIQEIQ